MLSFDELKEMTDPEKAGLPPRRVRKAHPECCAAQSTEDASHSSAVRQHQAQAQNALLGLPADGKLDARKCREYERQIEDVVTKGQAKPIEECACSGIGWQQALAWL